MGYFGGLGSGKGWNKFNFILTPNEFESLFTELQFYFVITNTRVPIDYKATDKPYVFTGYKDFFNEIIIGEKEYDRKEHWFYEDKIRISITDDIDKIDFENIDDKNEIVSKEFKRVRPTEPVINITPFYLYFIKDKESLSVAFMNTEGTIGLELTYPKFVSFLTDGDNSIIDAHTFNNYNLFNKLVKNIKSISHKAKVQSPAKLYRPNFWISPEAKKVINENRYLKSNELIIL
ncbi:hypothetical protein NJT12_22120 [Flavobacterium sp. AC]|uniref:Uncharacterized protein n=1 Tax=Flavobacterium azizsancarii TaxID=2961580 RepID=A0ABT4WIJ8_9FLAO|nr:hypothetical protein [Flavobacterium azizsancarii]MDA6072328.1 hypothetical protein [Flavobacterium azizsancarii]